jgi:hypothetical protein
MIDLDHQHKLTSHANAEEKKTVIACEFDVIILWGKENNTLLSHVPSHGGVLTAQYQLRKSNTYQPLSGVGIQWLSYHI